ncbi:urease accessory protein UreE [Sphingobacterium deserti]|uniref:Urease accessory protein UreE n=1 Tax=Sphingobacterium deserti TaxID=1229276 RepID=A0A0B8SYL2_9SPHI|nr:urease accessory protein UreE [Sphingobacterium deserti]KGE12312.1 urease accessory protein UreE [Sphingobacterium deserti]
MILSQGIAGNILHGADGFADLNLDFLDLAWHELDRGVLRKFTRNGQEIGFRNLTGVALQDGDVLFRDAQSCIVVKILPCMCLVIQPKNKIEMASVCFEIGNRHLPIAIPSADEVLIAFEEPLRVLFEKRAIATRIEERTLEQTQTLKIHAWTRKTKFKITLAKTIHESFVDTAAD